MTAHFSRKYNSRSKTCPGCSDTASCNNIGPKDTFEHILLACEAYSDLKDDYFDPDLIKCWQNFSIGGVEEDRVGT